MIALSKSQLPIKDAMWFEFYLLLSLLGHPLAENFLFHFWTFNLIGFSGKGTFQKRSRGWTLGLVRQCSLSSWNQSSGSVEITGPFSSLVTLCFILVCKGIRMSEGRNQKMQQILNRKLALLIILNCMFSVMIPSRDNLLPCSILEGDQQSDLFCTFVRVSALAIFAKCTYSIKPTQWSCKKTKSLKLVIYLKAGVLRQEPGESGWYALQSAVQSARIQFTNHSSLKKMHDKDHLE